MVAVAHEALDKLHAQAQEKQPLSPRRAVNEQAVLRVLHEVPHAEPPCPVFAAAPHSCLATCWTLLVTLRNMCGSAAWKSQEYGTSMHDMLMSGVLP